MQTLTPIQVEELRAKARDGALTREEAKVAIAAIRKTFSSAQAASTAKASRSGGTAKREPTEDVDFF